MPEAEQPHDDMPEAEQPHDDIPAFDVQRPAPPAPQAELEEEAPHGELEEMEIGTRLQPAEPDWLRGKVDELVAYVAAHRGINEDWRHLHEAAKAGRYEVVSQMCNVLHISVLQTNKRGRAVTSCTLQSITRGTTSSYGSPTTMFRT
jgi:hypothetical protein